MFRDLYHQGIHELDVFEAWACHGRRNQPGVSGCATWTQAAPGLIYVSGDQVTYRDADSKKVQLGKNELELANGLYHSCYTKRGHRAISHNPRNPLKRIHKTSLPHLDGWNRQGEIPRAWVLPER